MILVFSFVTLSEDRHAWRQFGFQPFSVAIQLRKLNVTRVGYCVNCCKVVAGNN